MVKILCLGSFITGLLAAALNYTIQYFGLDEEINNEREEIIKNEI